MDICSSSGAGDIVSSGAGDELSSVSGQTTVVHVRLLPRLTIQLPFPSAETAGGFDEK